MINVNDNVIVNCINLNIFLDVDGIKYVINFDYPNSSEDYIHRIGRTGRSKSKGTSYAFFTPSNCRQARDLVSVLQEANQVSRNCLTSLIGYEYYRRY